MTTSPVEDVVRETFDSFDRLQLKWFATRLEDFVSKEHIFVDGSLVVGLSAPFGAGKSTFLKMWMNDLDNRRSQDKDMPLVILLNAWESDYSGDPLLPLLSEIALLVDTHRSAVDQCNAESLKNAAAEVADLIMFGANSIAAKVSGFDGIKALEYVERKKGARSSKKTILGEGILKAFVERKLALERLKKAFKDCFSGRKIFFFVDELDRCRPDYAVQFIENIKHFFDADNAVFFLAFDRKQMEVSVKNLFGDEINFCEYMRKFIHRNIDFPTPNEEVVSGVVAGYIKRYLFGDSLPLDRDCALDASVGSLDTIRDVARSFAPTLRQLQEILRIIGYQSTFDGVRNVNKNLIPWAYGHGLILMSFLFVLDRGLFLRIYDESISFADLVALIEKVGTRRGRAEWWAKFLLTGTAKSLQPRGLEETLKDFRAYLGGGVSYVPQIQDIGDFIAGWGRPCALSYVGASIASARGL